MFYVSLCILTSNWRNFCDRSKRKVKLKNLFHGSPIPNGLVSAIYGFLLMCQMSDMLHLSDLLLFLHFPNDYVHNVNC